MNGTLKALNRIGAKKEAEKELDRALRAFTKVSETEQFHNGLWDISEDGIEKLEAALARVKNAKRSVAAARAKFELALEPVSRSAR